MPWRARRARPQRVQPLAPALDRGGRDRLRDRDAPVWPPRRIAALAADHHLDRVVRPQRGEVADPLERDARVADQVLVAQVEELVGSQVPREVVGAADGRLPARRRGRQRHLGRIPSHRDLRGDRSARVAHDVDVLGVREHREQRPDEPAVGRPLVAPARLAVRVGAECQARLDDRADRRRSVGHAADRSLAADAPFAQPRAPVFLLGEDPLGEAAPVRRVPQVAEAEPLPPQRPHEVRLARDREIGVVVEHRPQQRGAGARARADEQRTGRCARVSRRRLLQPRLGTRTPARRHRGRKRRTRGWIPEVSRQPAPGRAGRPPCRRSARPRRPAGPRPARAP